MSLFGRREKRRIAELEEQLRAAIEDQVTVVVSTPEPIRQTMVGLTKGRWYHISYKFRVGEHLRVQSDGHVVTEEPGFTWFDGSTP